MRWPTWLLVLTVIILGLGMFLACGEDDDDDNDDNDDVDDDDLDDDDDDDDDDDNDTDDDDDDDTGDDDTDEETWPGPPWFGCTDEDEPETATIVTAFDLVDHYYDGDDNQRSVDKQVTFPDGDWSQVTMRVELSCPADGDCDNWDRIAYVFFIDNAGQPEEEALEMWRYITPYNIGMCMLADMTAFAPLLTGTQTIRSQIDTWVGPNTVGDGHGWRVTIKFIFHPAKDEAAPDHIFNLWESQSIEVGNPDNPINDQIGVKTATLPATVSKAEVRVLVTGHGQGNKDNCAEFCLLDQVVMVNGTPFSFDPWRLDCALNPNGPGQAGTWNYPRAGWCPGAPVAPQVFDVTDQVTAGAENTFSYEVWEDESVLYENTCRPGAGNVDNYCEGCVFDDTPGNCDYNSTFHTTPTDRIAVQLFVWE